MKFSRVLLYLVASLFVLGGIIYAIGIRYNFTPSFARGFYIIQDSPEEYVTGNLIIFCPPNNEAFKLARGRHYVERGVCGVGNYRPLIKRVMATEGDTVVITQDVQVNGVLVPNSTIMTFDSKSRPIKAFEGGIVPAGSFFLMSDENPNSYDGRYYGFIAKEHIIGLIKPL